MTSHDPITLEIIQSSIQAISDEMFASIRKTAMSPIIYEVLDMGTAVTDGNGELASAGSGIPGFIGTLDKAVMAMIEAHPEPGEIRPGDVFIANDPYHGGVNHLNDLIIAMPVFSGDRILAWTANIAHHNDVGGMLAGSVSNEAREIYQEGLRIPATKIIDAGETIRPVIEILELNSRLPEFLRGDLWATIAAARLGERRLGELITKYGPETFEAALISGMDYAEQISLKAIADLPKGRFEFEEEQENGSIFKAVVEITEDQFVVDLRDNPKQDEGPYNSSREGSEISAQMVFKNVTDPRIATNAGTFRPLEVLTERGTVFDAEEPAAFSIYAEVEIRQYDLLWRCLAEAMPERLPAGGFASICGTYVSGVHPDTRRRYTLVEPQIGGWGGDSEGDGANAQFSAVHGETFNCPAEVAEARYGIYVDQLSLNEASGGEGRHRGGRGIVVDYRVRENGTTLTTAFTRDRIRPWPLAGGQEGSSNYVEVFRSDGGHERFANTTDLVLDEGDVIRIHTGNGAGFGDPGQRDIEAVLKDVRLGFLSYARAREIYGVDGRQANRTGLP